MTRGEGPGDASFEGEEEPSKGPPQISIIEIYRKRKDSHPTEDCQEQGEKRGRAEKFPGPKERSPSWKGRKKKKKGLRSSSNGGWREGGGGGCGRNRLIASASKKPTTSMRKRGGRVG